MRDKETFQWKVMAWAGIIAIGFVIGYNNYPNQGPQKVAQTFQAAFPDNRSARHTANYGQILDASCYVYRRPAENEERGGSGSGCVIGVDEANVYILTAGHVVKSKDRIGWIYFTHGGQWVGRMDFKVEKIQHDQYIDLAILVVTKKEFTRAKVKIPTPLRIATIDIGTNKTIITSGYPLGTWQNLFLGRTLRNRTPYRMSFYPIIAKGRSGSPVINSRTEIVGVVIQYSKTNSWAMNLKQIRKFVND